MIDFIEHSFSSIPKLRVVSTRRSGGVSAPPFDSLNLGLHVNDESSAVLENRHRLSQQLSLPADPVWLNQVHGTEIQTVTNKAAANSTPMTADAILCKVSDQPCAILTADCLPLVLARSDGSAFAVVHVGWRGFAAGIIERCLVALESKNVKAWAGPAIGPAAFEVGEDVRQQLSLPDEVWQSTNQKNKWMLDLVRGVELQLRELGVTDFGAAHECTYQNPDKYFSYRRDGVTGRQTTIAWLNS